MKDFPMFTTEYGVASLILKEIPYKQEAYIHIQSSLEPDKLLEECISFCRICGAERIYASGLDNPERFSFHTAVWEMRGNVPIGDIYHLFPVTEKTVVEWRNIHNEKLRNVPNAGTLESKDEKMILESGGAYFLHENGELMGIGWLQENKLEVIAALQKGAGEKILRTMQSLIPDEQMLLEVASANEKAVSLYTRMGFLKTREIACWYQVK